MRSGKSSGVGTIVIGISLWLLAAALPAHTQSQGLAAGNGSPSSTPKPIASLLTKKNEPPEDIIASEEELLALFYFLDTVPNQGEFEKTADYDRKVADALDQTVKGDLKGNSLWSFALGWPYYNQTIGYDPDSEIMRFSLPFGFWMDLPKGAAGAITNIRERSGNRDNVAVIAINHDEFFGNLPNIASDGRNPYWPGFALKVKVPNTEAPSLKANGKAAYIFRPAKPFRGSFISRPAIFVCLEALRLYDSATGKVFFDSRNTPVETEPTTSKQTTPSQKPVKKPPGAKGETRRK